MPKKNYDLQYLTPIKKWKKTSPFQEDLAIIESDESNPQPELFSALVDSIFPILEAEQPSLAIQQFQQQLSDPFYFSPSESNSHHSNPIVNPHKINLPLTSQKAPLQPIDTNRRGCKCQKSKCNKKYCDCLRSGLTCADGVCNCQNCNNREQKQVHREIFKKLSNLQTENWKGCHCKKSRCHKKYCECHSAGKQCGKSCECIDCENVDHKITKYDKMYKLVKRQCLIQ